MKHLTVHQRINRKSYFYPIDKAGVRLHQMMRQKDFDWSPPNLTEAPSRRVWLDGIVVIESTHTLRYR